MRIVTTGGRDYTNIDLVQEVLSGECDPDLDVIIHGGARGADTLVGLVAARLGIDTIVVEPEWDKHEPHCGWACKALGYCRLAGPRRNEKMIAMGADLVIAFPGGAGTAHCVGVAEEAGVRVLHVDV